MYNTFFSVTTDTLLDRIKTLQKMINCCLSLIECYRSVRRYNIQIDDIEKVSSILEDIQRETKKHISELVTRDVY